MSAAPPIIDVPDLLERRLELWRLLDRNGAVRKFLRDSGASVADLEQVEVEREAVAGEIRGINAALSEHLRSLDVA